MKVFLLTLSAFLFWGCAPRDSQEPVQVVVKPNFFQLPVGGEIQFSAEVSGTLDQAVQWEVNGAGGSISQAGRYRAPLTVTTQPATVQAKSVADPTAVGNGAVETTAVREWPGEALRSDVLELIIGGYTVRAGQTIDLNGDNILDLIALSKATNEVAFFLGLGAGDGRFTKPNPILITDPVAVAVADFITEGVEEFSADAAIACRVPCEASQSKIALVQGSPQNAFSLTYLPGLDLPTGTVPLLLAAGRFHGEVEARNSDLVVGTEDGSIILFLQNRVTGAFAPTAPVSVGKPVRFAVADFNRDIFLDLAVVREESSDVLILLGDGAGGFPSQATVPMPAQPTAIAVGDFNADEIPDLAAAFSTLKSLSTSIGKGDGTFQPPTSIALNSEPGSIVVEDINLDRVVGTDRVKANPRHDIAVTLPGRNEIVVLFGDGEGNMIGEWIYKTGVASVSLLAGFFSGPQSPTGFQTVGLIYINENVDKFFLVNNSNF